MNGKQCDLIVSFVLSKQNKNKNKKAKGLEQITAEKTAQVMQVSSGNPMVGLEGRASLLVNLSHALKSNPTFFGAEGRPGNMIGSFASNFVPLSLCPPDPVVPSDLVERGNFWNRFPRIRVHRRRSIELPSRPHRSPLARPHLGPHAYMAPRPHDSGRCPSRRCLAMRSANSTSTSAGGEPEFEPEPKPGRRASAIPQADWVDDVQPHRADREGIRVED